MNERIDAEQIREIIRIAEEADLTELEVEVPSLKVRVRRGAPAHPAASGHMAAGTASTSVRDATAPVAAQETSEPGLNHLEPIVAPMVGTFYRSPSPDAPPFVNEGDFVDEGQVVCIIEAMKLFNEIQAERRGRVARILVENASPVEYGQPLLLLDTGAHPG
ncbi:MAG: acetyl-CoA carboxylase biotin carboxyl carrier protein [Armatimonadota bacterium]|nr:acetyl-CoA carboxylase biotin carboxyl carrier protein [Armatimonadota bacterium]